MERISKLEVPNFILGFDAKRVFCNQVGLGNYGRTLLKNLSFFYPELKLNLFTPKKELTHLDDDLIKGKFDLHMPKGSQKLIPGPLWRSKYIINDILKAKVQIYHGLSHEIPFSLKPNNIKSVVTIHDLIYLRHPELFRPIDRSVYNFKFRYACKNADRVLAISHQTANDIVEFFGTPAEKIKVVYQAVSEKFFNKWSDQNKQDLRTKYKLPKDFVLYIGTLEPRKNALGILKAIKQLQGKLDTAIVMVGKGKHYKEKLLQYVSENNLSSQVIFPGFVDDMDLPGLYQCAKLLVSPSFYEGWGLPIAEALVSETPVVSSKGSCFSEAGGEHSIYVNPHDPEEIAFNIQKVLEDSQLSQSMIEHGVEHSKVFKPQKVTRDLIELYLEVFDL